MAEFLKAIRANDVKKVEKKLKKGFNINQPIEEYDSKGFACQTIPLCVAAARGYQNIVGLLCSYGANIHASNKDWSSPMHTATYHGHLNVMRQLIARNVNTDNRDQHGDTCLHVAVKRSNLEAIEVLLEKPLDTEVKNNEGKTALDIATDFRFDTIIVRLKQVRPITTVLVKAKPNTAPKPSPKPSLESEKEKLQQQLEQIELKEINTQIRDKQSELIIITTEIQDGEAEASTIKSKLTSLEKKLKEVRQMLLAKETMKTKLKEDIATLERRKNKQIQKKSQSGPKEDSFECPICFNLPLPPIQVFQCEKGHIYCSECKDKPRMNNCPQCRVTLSKENPIRNLMYEEIVADVFG